MGNRWKNYIKQTKVCEECGKIFYVKPCRKYKTRFCSYDCYWKWLKRNTLRGENSPFWKLKIFKICKECKNKFEVIPANDYRKFCSRKCFIEWQKKHPQGFIKNHWSKNPKLREETIRKMSESLKGRKAWNKGILTRFLYRSGMRKGEINRGIFKRGFDEKRVKTQFKKGYDPRRGRPFSSEYNPMFNQKLKDKARKNSLMSQHKRPTKPEQILMDLIQQNQLPYKYVGNGEVLFGGKNPDFIQVNGKKKLIEIFGSYWHKNDNPKERIDFFKKYGFSTLIIWDKELENSQNVVNKIKVFDNE